MTNNLTKCFNKDVEIKASSDADKMRFEGYLARFDNVDSYGDVIQKGAFVNTLNKAKKEGRVLPVLKQHGTMGGFSGDDTPIGYFEDAYEDSKGLYVKGVLFSTTEGKNMYALLKEAPLGTMGMSIGYRVVGKKTASEEEYRKTGVVQYLTEIDLREGSIVTFPANDQARVEDVKSEALRWRGLEKHLAKNGFSASEAKKAVSLFKSFEPTAPTAEESKAEQDTQAVKSLSDSLKEAEAEMERQEALRSLKNFVENL